MDFRLRPATETRFSRISAKNKGEGTTYNHLEIPQLKVELALTRLCHSRLDYCKAATQERPDRKVDPLKQPTL